MSGRASVLGVVLLVARIVAAGGTAYAQSADTDAEQEFRLGYRALQAGNCSAALVHYRRSLELVQRPRTLFNIATCEEDLGQQAAAWRDYQSFVSLAEERDAAIVTEARTRLEGLRKRLHGQLLLESTPAGASVAVDGERQARGDTPVTLSLEPGRHVLSLSVPGAAAVERIVDIAPEDQTSLKVELALASSISIRTDPVDAVIDPQGDGATAIGHLDVPVRPGRHSFSIRRDGYRTEHVEIDAVAGRTHEVRVNLRPAPKPPSLVVTGAADATIAIDGIPTSTSVLRALSAGDHQVVIERGGRVVWRRDLQFSPGEIVRLDVDLPRPRSTRRRAIAWSVGGFGLASIAAGGVVGTLALRDVTSDHSDVHERGKSRALAADGLFVVGGAALVVAWRLLRDDTASASVRRENGAP